MLKQYISEHRNDTEAFETAMEVLMECRDPANRHPYPFKLANPEAEVEAFLGKSFSSLI